MIPFPIQQDLLVSEATRFRYALEQCQPFARKPAFCSLAVMASFPNGCCKVSSQLLARYLVEQRVIPREHILFSVNGCRMPINKQWTGDDEYGNENQTHAWLETGDTIVDITADQFPDQSQKVIVTSNRLWHDLFNGQDHFAYNDMMKFNDYFESGFNQYYTLVREFVSSGHL